MCASRDVLVLLPITADPPGTRATAEEQIMSTTYEIEPSTTAAAWASSPLGEPICESTEPWDEGTERDMHATKPTSIARHAVVVVALACGIGFGAAFGLAMFDSTDMTQPVVVVPRVDVPTGGPTSPARLPDQHPAPTPEHQPPPEPSVAASESTPEVVEGAPTAADAPPSEVSSPTVAGPSHPNFAPPSSGNPGDTSATVDIDIPQLPQPEPASPQTPGPTIELEPASDDLPILTPQLPPKVTLLPPKSRWTVNESVQKPTEPTRGMPPTNRTRLNSVAGTGTAGDE